MRSRSSRSAIGCRHCSRTSRGHGHPQRCSNYSKHGEPYAVARATRKILDEMRAKAERDNAEPPLALPVLHWHGEVDLRDSDPQLVQDLLPEVGSGLISGQWGTYKTFVVFDLAHAIMSGEPFLGHEVWGLGGVVVGGVGSQTEGAA